MNMHGALNHLIWRVGVHDVEDRMNYPVPLDSHERRHFRFGVHQNFHESVRLDFFPRTADAAWQANDTEVLTATAIFVTSRGYVGSQRLSDSFRTGTRACREYRRLARSGHGGDGPRSRP